jgi:hypothetical protein
MMKGSSLGGAMNDMETETYTGRITNVGHDTGMRLPWEEIEGTFGRIPIIGQRLRQFPRGLVRMNGIYRWLYSMPDNVQDTRADRLG